MENKARKMFAAVVVIMLCAVAIVGVGYAYTAKTSNTGNTVTSEYIQLSQEGAGKYTFTAANEKVYYDTVNTAEDTFTYDLTANVLYNSPVTGYKVVHIGDQLTLRADQSTTAEGTLTCSFVTTGFTYNETWALFMISYDGSTTTVHQVTTSDNHWSDADFTFLDGGDDYNPVTIDFYYGFAADSAVATAATAPLDTPLNGATITFTVEKAGNNKGILLDARAITGTVDQSGVVLNATLLGGVTGDITWISSQPSYVTVPSGAAASKTLTLVAAGTSVITASVTSGGVTYTATCTVTVEAVPVVP